MTFGKVILLVCSEQKWYPIVSKNNSNKTSIFESRWWNANIAVVAPVKTGNLRQRKR